MKEIYNTSSAEETKALAARFVRTLKAGDVVAYRGDLGAGKTTFTQGAAQGAGVGEIVSSPTFTLINEYQGNPKLYHMDLYRLNGLTEMENIGIEEYLYGDGICFIEWSEKMDDLLPRHAIVVTFRQTGDTSREITIERCDD